MQRIYLEELPYDINEATLQVIRIVWSIRDDSPIIQEWALSYYKISGKAMENVDIKATA